MNRLAGRLTGHPVADALDRAVITLLDPADPKLGNEALDFLMRAPSDATAARILALWDDENDGDVRNPIDVLFPLHAEDPELAATGLRKLAADGLISPAAAADFARSLLPTNAALRADFGVR